MCFMRGMGYAPEVYYENLGLSLSIGYPKLDRRASRLQ